jgi:hypothetical protein
MDNEKNESDAYECINIFTLVRKIKITTNHNYKTIDNKEPIENKSNRSSKTKSSEGNKASTSYFSFLNTASSFWKDKLCLSKNN